MGPAEPPAARRTPRPAGIAVCSSHTPVHEPLAPAHTATAAPGRLEVARQLKARSSALAATLGTELPIALEEGTSGNTDLRAVTALLALLDDAFAAVVADPLGKQAVTTQLDSIRLGAGERSTARLIDRTLHIRTARDPLAQWTPAELRAAIEKAL
jgi:hypothetical protein